MPLGPDAKLPHADDRLTPGCTLVRGSLMRAMGLAASLAVALSGCAGLVARPQPADTVAAIVATAASWGEAGAMGVPFAFDPVINALSLLFAAAIGVLFGYFPARRQPEALGR